jgi:hypothetical protein
MVVCVIAGRMPPDENLTVFGVAAIVACDPIGGVRRERSETVVVCRRISLCLVSVLGLNVVLARSSAQRKKRWGLGVDVGL